MTLWDLEHRFMMHPGLIFEVARRLLCNLGKVSNWAAGEAPTLVEKCLRDLEEWHKKEEPGRWSRLSERDLPVWVAQFPQAKEAFLLKENAKRRKMIKKKGKVASSSKYQKGKAKSSGKKKSKRPRSEDSNDDDSDLSRTSSELSDDSELSSDDSMDSSS